MHCSTAAAISSAWGSSWSVLISWSTEADLT
jgi:hypothetical protein